ncbi:Stk1 family PASTA domain-containing Ser/Thr kinase [Sporosarcina sp. HYO08]|uniref:Stk1 family PASTA domain-containing Ser/Thr kinase n=1 Tax=Sporosarcina sp. HYO08 TaxID=1759557 RepID=UPI000798F1B5|nr:Stk1 family PASTA domain-containing Ser/Thr kinase [Sporosarcina sp. HYO08]KXH79938.1 serine/threonine protein kinase [Sporosarcina sp. HYO08]
MIGRRIGGRYEVLHSIGDGGMSKVYLAHDVILDRDVAIKVLNYEFANEEELKRRFLREALSATSLTHPNIVNIFDVGEDGELHYLVMEYVEGQTLKKYILEHGPLSPEQALPIMRQLVSAIANAHHNGIVHRDVKPQNILMDAEGNVKITDFGIAMALSATSHTKTNSVIGTVHYLSPEQARGGMATKKSDIYSLGIVFYELLSGELPFSAETAVAIALKHLQEETPSIREKFPSIPQSVENVILKATAKDALHRYRSADEMYEDLLTVLEPERAQEEKFGIPYDDDQTRVIPIIKEKAVREEDHEVTKKMEPIQPATPAEPVKKKRKKWPIFLGVSIGIIALLAALLFIPGILRPKQAIIPDVSNMNEVEASDALVEEGFVIERSIEQPSEEIEAGNVIRTVPEAGKERDVGTPITLYISTGKEKIPMSDYVGRDFTQVANLLAGYDFLSIDEPIEEFSDEDPGTILKQDPAPGEEVVPSETVIAFTISKGKDMRTLGDLRGLDRNQLKEYEKSSGFTIRDAGSEHSSTVQEGHVISQQPEKGASLQKGSLVDVIFSKGPPKKPVKLHVRTIIIPYEPEVTNQPDTEEDEAETGTETEQPKPPQTVRIYIQDRKHSIKDVFVEFTITETTKRQIQIELEEGQSGAYQVKRDDEVIEEKTFSYDDE